MWRVNVLRVWGVGLRVVAGLFVVGLIALPGRAAEAMLAGVG